MTTPEPPQANPDSPAAVFLPPTTQQAPPEPPSAPERDTAPRPPVAVYLRGAGASKSTWETLAAAVAGQGWIATRERTQAWHLARGGLATVMVDFSDVDLSAPGAARVTVARVRAKYDVQQRTVPVGRLLQAADRRRLEGAAWLNEPVGSEVREPVLPDDERVTVRLRSAGSDAVTTDHLVRAVLAASQ